MTTQNQDIGVWGGVATYKNTTFRVCVIAKEGSWMGDLVRAVNHAGGYNVRLEQETGEPNLKTGLGISLIRNAKKLGMPFTPSYVIDFEPDNVLTERASCRASVTVLMKSDFSIIKDGEFQTPQKNAKSTQQVASSGRQAARYKMQP